jgi:hypothetical protein
MLKRVLGCAVAVAAVLVPSAAALAGPSPTGSANGKGHDKDLSFSYAVYGDAPYGTSPTDTSETDATPAFIRTVNADRSVEAVVHVGDIHSGSQYCTAAYDRQVYGLWTAFADPMVYTPGDNEWADCHKKKEGGGTYNPATGAIDYVLGADGRPVGYAGGDPIANLDLVRSIFFAKAGKTLGSGKRNVTSQARAYDHSHPTDKQFVENVIWSKNDVEFVTVNIPGGSNNAADPWYGAPAESATQIQMRHELTGAATRWIDAAFAQANKDHAAGVVIINQADMWDVDGNAAGAAHLSNFEPIIKAIADQSRAFGNPVLMLNGDSHVYRSDNPLQQGAPCTGDDEDGVNICISPAHNVANGSNLQAWNSHPSYDVPNFHRIVVHGSTMPLEYLRLTIDPHAHHASTDNTFGIFAWQRVTD